MTLPLLVVDAFTSEPFRGNPAAVVLLDEERTAAWMRSVAAEMKHSETAFVLQRAPGELGLRWFTPEVEVDLCGHATLAAAHALVHWGVAPPSGTITFHTRSGPLHASSAAGGFELDFPVAPCRPWAAPGAFFSALGLEPREVVRGSFFALVEVDDAATVCGLAPDFAALAAVDVDATIVAAPGDEGSEVVTRVFGPRIGIPEDPVTGAAQCLLAPYFAPRLGPELRVHQASARGGELRVRLDGDRVRIGGHAVTVLEGTLRA